MTEQPSLQQQLRELLAQWEREAATPPTDDDPENRAYSQIEADTIRGCAIELRALLPDQPVEEQPGRCPMCGGGIIGPDSTEEGRMLTWRNVGATRASFTDRPCTHPWHDQPGI